MIFPISWATARYCLFTPGEENSSQVRQSAQRRLRASSSRAGTQELLVSPSTNFHALAGDVLVADLGTDGATANTFHHLAGHEDLHTVRVSKS